MQANTKVKMWLRHRLRLGSFLQMGVAVCLLLSGCPKRFDPRAQVLSGGSPNTDPDFVRAELARKQGLAAYAEGDFDRARQQLAPLSDDIVDCDEGAELHATLADVYKRLGDAENALREYERLFQSAFVRPGERFYLRQQARALCDGLPGAASNPLSDAVRKKRCAFVTGLSHKKTDDDESTLRVGFVLPFSGKDRVLGEQVSRGALFAAGLLGGDADALAEKPAVDLRFRDAHAGNLPKLVAELAQEGVTVLVAPPLKNEGQTVCDEAERQGLWAVSLSPRETPSNATLKLFRPAKARAQALAQHLKASGLRTVAVLAPSTPFGQNQSRAFIEALQGSHVQVVAELSFAETATTFLGEAKQLALAPPDALFLPVSATQLSLIASQLATEGLLATARVSKTAKGEALSPDSKVQVVLSLAEGLNPRLLASAGRYLQGAVLAPLSLASVKVSPKGSGPGSGQPFASPILEYPSGEEATSLDALGYDAVRFVRAVCQKQPSAVECTGGTLAQKSPTVVLEGATGRLGFDATGQRLFGPPLVRVVGQTLEAIAP